MTVTNLRYYPAIIGISILISSISCSCEKRVTPNVVSGTGTGSSSSDSTTVTPPASTTPQRTFTVGSGGSLTIDGNNFVVNGQTITLQNNDLIKINAGIYKQIAIQNISVPTTGNPVTITNNGLVEVSGNYNQMGLGNLNNVTISGNGTSGINRGFYFHDNTYMAIVANNNNINNFTLQYVSLYNIGNSGINFPTNTIYTGASTSYMKNLKFSYIDANNQGGTLIGINGGIGTAAGDPITGFVDGLEIDHLSCINSPDIGSVIWLGCVRGFNIHDDYINNINTANDNHNGIFFIIGNGKFYNNVITNNQGNALRSRPWNLNSTDGLDVEIYNNIFWNSRKYGAFELQITPDMLTSPNLYPANCVVYNNTAGKISSASSGYAARLIDLYRINSTLSYYNNLMFNDEDSLFLNQEYPVTIIRNDNNVYKANTTDAVYDTINFISKISGVGASTKP